MLYVAKSMLVEQETVMILPITATDKLGASTTKNVFVNIKLTHKKQ